MKIKSILLILIFLMSVMISHAQYYSWGADPAHLKWMSSKTDKASVIYPTSAEQIGLTTLYFTKQMRPYIDYGFTLPPLDLPFVVHPENMRSNGLVMWLPKRVEFLSTPAIDGYSMPWIKQLVAHEYRHAAQYNNLNVGFIKFLSYLLGEQSSTVGLIFMPLWMIEGDATMCETQASSYGRALQPRFTLEYRAMGDITNKYRNPDKLFCGSYRDFTPDHYQLGYQLVAHGNELAGTIIANDMAAYGPRHPWTFISEGWRMKHLFGFSTSTLFRKTFSHLHTYWQSLPQVENSSEPLPTPKISSYTSYANPLWVNSKVIMQKTNFDQADQLVMLNPTTGDEQRLCYTGSISTRPAYDKINNRLWWTEYRRSMMFEQKVKSSLCYLDLDKKQPRTKNMRGKNILYPTPDNAGGLAWIEYATNGIYSFHHKLCDGNERSFSLPFGHEIHSLAWDNTSQHHFCIITSDEGMWIARIDDEYNLSPLTRPAYITLSKLRAENGKLYFGSIASGKDEVHCFDLSEGKEYQISQSTYGSFDPAPADDKVLMTTYDSMGYHPAVQKIDKLYGQVGYSSLPRNIVNPPRKNWGTINLDTVSMVISEQELHDSAKKTRRYRKALHLFNFHSWAPLSYDPFSLSESSTININAGATVMTQNLLSSMQGFFSYGYGSKSGHIFKGALRYYGLGPIISINATYGGHQNIYPVYTYNPNTHEFEFPEPPSRDKFYAVGASLTLPLLLHNGYHTRQLVASTGWEFSNGLVANTGKFQFKDGISNVATIGYKQGLHLTQFNITYQDFVRLAHRDFAPRWGFTVSASYATNPTNGSFSDLAVFYTKLYTPGFFRHNSLTLDLAYQNSFGGFHNNNAVSTLSFKSTKLLPRGFDSTQIDNHNYMAMSLNYQFPVWYPDGGWRGIIYFKRMRLNVGYDMAHFQHPRFLVQEGKVDHTWHKLHSYGGDIVFDINVLSQPASATTAIKLSFYKPSEGGFFFGAGMELPF
ncbi:MAG: hypothetical protein J6V27_03150 [Alistipes sp.]|nr:hypothetical protein [Alistipes sp.]